MAATAQNVKDFFGLAGFTVTDAHLLRMRAALATQRYGEDGAVPTPNDFIDWLYRQAAAFINRVTENDAKAAVVVDPDDLLA